MTDSSTSGTPTSSGADRGDALANGDTGVERAPAPPAASDASIILAELERKLHELERDLTSIGSAARRPAASDRPSDPFPAPPPGGEAPLLPAGTHGTARLVDEAHLAGSTASPPPPTDDAARSDAARLASALPPGRLGPSGDPHLASGERHVAEDSDPSHDTTGQLEMLLRFRDQLERTARDLINDYDRLLAHLDASTRHDMPAAESTHASRVPAPASAPAHGGPAAQSPPADGAPPADIPGSPPPSTDPAESLGLADRGESHEELTIEGQVQLDAGPFSDLDALSAFESTLTRLPHALDARVRSFDGVHAAIDLRLALPAMVVQEMREALAVGFRVVDSRPGRLAIMLEVSDGP